MKLPNDISILTDLGLTENEAQVYLYILENPELTAADVARELSMDKSSCYRAVESLVEQNLLIVRPKTRGSTYTAVHPNQLTHLLDKKKTQLKIQSQTLADYINSLNSQLSTDNYIGTGVKIERGIEGLKNMMEDRITESGTTQRERWFSNHPLIKDLEWSTYIKDYAKRRIAKNISIKGLYDAEASKSAYGELMKSSPSILKQVRLLPDSIDNKQAFVIYSNKVAFITPDKAELTIVTISEPLLATLLSDMFDFIWDRSEEI